MAQATVGALRVSLGASTAQYEAGMRRAQAQARATGQSISTSFGRAQASTTAAFGRINAAAAALGVGLTVGAAGLASAATSALSYAANLTELSAAMGVTVEQYQILERASVENGVAMETTTRAVQILNRTLGEARAGVDRAQQSFAALGIDPEQFRSAGEALPVVIERISRLRTSSEQAAAAQRLLGRGAAALLPLLQQGAAGYNRIADEARQAGLVTAEMARRADEANDKLALLAITLRTSLASGLLGILDPLDDVSDGLARIGRNANSAIQQLLRLAGVQSAQAQAQARGAAGGVLGGAARMMLATNPITGPAYWLSRLGRNDPYRGAGAGQAFLDQLAAARARGGGADLDLDPDTGGGGRGGRGGRDDSARLREEALRNEADFQSRLRQFRSDILRAQQEQVTDSVARSQIDDQILDIEREQYQAELALQVSLGELTAARAEQLQAAHDATDEERRQTNALQRGREIAEENVAIDEARGNLTREALEQQRELAQTAAEQREAQMRLLDLSYRQIVEREKAVLADADSSRAAVAEAQARLKALDAWRAAEQQIIRLRTQGPLETFLDRLPTTAAKANEALQQVAVNGLQSIEDGLLSILDGTKSVGEAFRDMAQSIISDLIRIQIQRAIIIPLTNALGGGSSGGGGMDWISAALNIGAAAAGGGKVPMKGFASGGIIHVGGRGGIDRNFLSLNGMPVARVSQGEDINITPRGRLSRDRVMGDLHIHMSGVMSQRQARETGSQLARATQREIARAARVGMA